MREHILGGAVVAAALTIGFACGGSVVVDPEDGAGGAGGAMTMVTTSSNGEGGAGALCPVPEPVGQAIVCGGSGSSGTGVFECITGWCDEAGNIYEATCTAQACTCAYNFQIACSCAIDVDDICAGSAAPCCPFPFPL